MYAARQLDEVYRNRVQVVLRRLEQALQPFARALDDFLAVLFASRLPPDWRERWHRFVAEQQLLGFTVAPQSVRELETWIEAWARRCRLLPLGEVGAIPGAVADDKPLIPLNRPAPRSRLASERFFDQKLDEAHRHLYMVERALRALADKLEVAKLGVEVEVETEVDRIEELVWSYNDALESARDEWLREKLSGDANTRLLQMRSPATLGLPAFVDREQAERARRQGLEIGKRLAGYDRSTDRLVATLEVVETASTVTGIVLGAGVVATAVKSGGKWAIVKTAIAVGTGYALDKALDKGLETAGARPEVIGGLRLAVAVFTLILIRRRGRPAPTASKSPSVGKEPATDEASTLMKPALETSKPPKTTSGGAADDLENASGMQPATTETPETTGVQSNRLTGDAVRDEIAAREAPSLTEQRFETVGGVRRVDVLKLGPERVAIESKVGRTALDSRVRQELARDWWLLRQGKVDRVIWEFSPSPTTHIGGPTAPLLQKLYSLGFEVRINP